MRYGSRPYFYSLRERPFAPATAAAATCQAHSRLFSLFLSDAPLPTPNGWSRRPSSPRPSLARDNNNGSNVDNGSHRQHRRQDTRIINKDDNGCST